MDAVWWNFGEDETKLRFQEIFTFSINSRREMRRHSGRMTIWESTWKLLVSFWMHFGMTCAYWLEGEKHRKNFQFFISFGSKIKEQILNSKLQGYFAAPERPPWRQDGPVCELGRVWGSFGRPLGLILAPSWSQDGAKLANLAPRCVQDG